MSLFKPALLVVLISLLNVEPAIAQTGKLKNNVDTGSNFLHLFVIGNSFSGNATRYLPEIAKDGGHKLLIGRAELGGCTLQRHWESVEASELNPDDPKGKPYKGKSLRMLLSEGTWDVVTIQQYSLISGDINTYMPYAKKLYDFIRSIQPESKIVMHQTWAYRADADGFGKINADFVAKDQQEMYEKSREAYHAIARKLGIDIIPTGDAFYQVDSDRFRGYKRDNLFSYSQPQYPLLPDQTNSLHVGYFWNNEKKLTFDSHHASAAGCYLGGLVWYSFLFNAPVSRIRFKPSDIEDQFAAYLRKTADQAVRRKSKTLAGVNR